MSYEDWSHFAQDWGTVYFVIIFAVALAYALWPRNGKSFKRAARLPIMAQEHGDDRPIT